MAELHRTLPLLPLRTGVVLPGMVLTMALESEEAAQALEAAHAASEHLVLVPFIEGRYSPIGVIAQVLESGEIDNGPRAVVVAAIERAHIGAAVPSPGNALWVQVDPIEPEPAGERSRELAREYRAVLESILHTRGARRLAAQLADVTEPGAVADLAGYSPDLSAAQKVQVLETLEVERRLELVLGWARETLAEIALRERIKDNVEEGLEKNQREFLLRRQLDAIRRELGELDGTADEDPDGYRRRLDSWGAPPETVERVRREIDRLERTSADAPESGWIRTWLDRVLALPFGEESSDNLDLTEARRVLDEDHEGLDEVKRRIVEHLGVAKLRRDRGLQELKRGSGAILALAGPPGVGKTSLGESVARALGRRFVRVALGGVSDEAEIRGHRRTYVGAQPGRIARALSEAGTMNPVILLDEVDKLGQNLRGDPAAALLEVLDPAQNHTFTDHYLEIPLDLSKVLFIATANLTDGVPPALLDRMEVLRIDGYSAHEKLAIARSHLLPRQLERSGLQPGDLELDDDAISSIITGYTHEAGVRQLERELSRVARKVATGIASRTDDSDAASPPAGTSGGRLSVEEVRALLGRPPISPESVIADPIPGVATGLAVTGAGGDVLLIEAESLPGPDDLVLTGQLGEVMRESAEIALSWVRAHREELGIDEDALRGRRIHLHVPAGAVPKDGPSAGITIASALVSLLTGRPLRPGVAMTGEVTLRGRVLPIGGVVAKLLAAHRAGCRVIVLPERNGGDLDDLPAPIREELEIHLATRLEEVLEWALQPSPAELPSAVAA